ncbi:RPGF3 factor, partial [Chloropsis hardwickii]|nr:RPGF3 factor [Chloropsis hardwickii]
QTPLLDSESSLDYGHSITQASSEKIRRAAKLLFAHLSTSRPGLIRDHKHHLRHHRQCCSGKDLVDWLLSAGVAVQTRGQAVGIGQVLVDGGVLTHVRQEWHFQDKETQFYRFAELELRPEPAAPRDPEELLEALGFLAQLGPDALLSMALRKPPAQRTQDELELIFEELLHIKAVAHLSNSVKRELAAVLMFEGHQRAGTVRESPGGTRGPQPGGAGAVPKIVDFPPSPGAVPDNCHFLRVDKQDFNRILKDVEANTVRLKEHGKVVLVLQRDLQGGGQAASARSSSRYLVMAGTPEKILEHLLEFMRLDATLYDPVDTLLGDFLLTYTVFMPTSQLCRALLHHFRAEPLEGSEQDKATYSLRKRRKILRLVSQWVLLYGRLLQGDRSTTALLQVRDREGGDTGTPPGTAPRSPHPAPGPLSPQNLADLASRDPRLGGLGQEQGQERRRPRALPRGGFVPVPSRDLSPPPRHSLPAERAVLPQDAVGVFTALGLNERLFVVSRDELGNLTPHPEQLGPPAGSSDTLDLISSKDLASHLTDYDWNLFKSIHQV